MPTARFFLQKPFKEKETVTLEGQENIHLRRVCKRKVGDLVELVNGLGELAKALILSTEEKTTKLLIKQLEKHSLTPPVFMIAQALPHVQKLDFIVEKGTELGCDLFLFFEGELSEKKGLSLNQTRRLSTIAESALKQCGRLDLPEIQFYPSLKTILEQKATFFFGDTDPKAPLFKSILEEKPLPPFCFIIGPESGFSKEEKEFLKTKAKGVKLHQNTLRTETASLAALTLMNHLRSIN
jgi:16S rRNA (uracil1498-N3)-methyltransferase